MDSALRDLILILEGAQATVLILVVMDSALRAATSELAEINKEVLILVVMDSALRGVVNQSPQWRGFSLNPCCNG